MPNDEYLRQKLHEKKEAGFDRHLWEVYKARPNAPTFDEIKRKFDERVVELLLELRRKERK